MRKTCLAIAVGLACAAAPALAQGQGPDQEQVQEQVPEKSPEQGQVQEQTQEHVQEHAKGQIERQVQDATPPNPPARFSFNRVDDGFLRLDTETGQVAFCGPHSVGWACQAVPEERAALEKEIARLHDEASRLHGEVESLQGEVGRLQGEVAGLRNEVAVLRESPPPPRPPADLSPPAGKSDDAKQLREDIERARAAVENAWRRLIEMIANLQKDIMRKG